MSVPTITIIGSLNADLTSYTARIPNGGETLHGHSFETGSGGKGGNQASACGRLSRRHDNLKNASATIRMIGAVGDDLYGQMLLSDLQASGVDTEGVAVRKDFKTGVAVIIVEETTGENRIILNAGANYCLKPEQFLTFSHPLPKLIILQLEIPIDTTVQSLEAAQAAGVEVLLNPAPASELPKEAYLGLAHLIVNESEAAILSYRSVEDLEIDENLPSVAAEFHARGVNNVIITLGSRGVFCSADGKHGLMKAKKVEVIDTTAAGDTFVGAYALEIANGVGVGDAVKKANEAAAKTVGKRGAQLSIPWMDEI
jgi:ribokinase